MECCVGDEKIMRCAFRKQKLTVRVAFADSVLSKGPGPQAIVGADTRVEIAEDDQFVFLPCISQYYMYIYIVLCLLPLACCEFVRFDINISISGPNPDHVSK